MAIVADFVLLLAALAAPAAGGGDETCEHPIDPPHRHVQPMEDPRVSQLLAGARKAGRAREVASALVQPLVADTFDEELAAAPLLLVAFCHEESMPRCRPFLKEFDSAAGVVLATFPENNQPKLATVDVEVSDDALWRKLNLAASVKEARREVTAAMPAVYAFRSAGGEVKAQKYSGPQKAVDFVKAIQGLMIRNTHAPGQQQ